MGNSIDKCSRITEDKIDKKLYKYKGCIQSAATNVNDRVKYLKSTDPNYKNPYSNNCRLKNEYLRLLQLYTCDDLDAHNESLTEYYNEKNANRYTPSYTTTNSRYKFGGKSRKHRKYKKRTHKNLH